MAFSSSSASRWATVSAWRPETSGSSDIDRSIRSNASISPTAVRMTSDSGSGRRRRRVESMPARTSRLSALRRIRVARWSSLKRLSRTSGSSSRASIVSSCESWRPSSTWLRRATLTNISAMLARSAACSLATCTVTSLTVLNASASRPISSRGLDRDRLDDDAGALTGGLHPLDHLRQLVADLAGGDGEAAQRAGDAAGQADGQQEGEDRGRGRRPTTSTSRALLLAALDRRTPRPRCRRRRRTRCRSSDRSASSRRRPTRPSGRRAGRGP